MADNDLQKMYDQFIELAPGIMCRICTKEALREGDNTINQQVLEQVRQQQCDIAIRVIKNLLDKKINEYCHHINGSISNLVVDFNTHSIMLAINKHKLPTNFEPVNVDPFNPADDEKIKELVKMH